MKTTKKLVAMLIVCMLLMSVTTCAAFADNYTMHDVWIMLGDTVYERGSSTLKATGEAGRESFTFEDASMQSFVLPVQDLTISYDEDCDIYSAETDEYSVELVITDGALDAIGFWGIYDPADECTFDYDGYYIDSTRERDGSHYYPWFVGTSAEDKVYAEYDDGFLTVYGEGSMMDYDDPATRPWNDFAADVCHLSVDTGVTAIGKNAFKGLGSSDFPVFVSLNDGLIKIGDSAFEGFAADPYSSISFPETLNEVGSRAFADTALSEIFIYGGVIAIADDAFAGVTAKVDTVCGSGWTEEYMKNYGGNLTYELQYKFEIEEVYDDETLGATTMYLPAGECEVSLASMDEDYSFVGFEVIEGTLPEGIDVTNPELSFNICDNVKLKVYYVSVDAGDDDEHDTETEDVDPVPSPVPSPDPGKKDVTEKEISGDKENPKTDDSRNITLWYCVLSAAFMCFALSFIPTKKTED